MQVARAGVDAASRAGAIDIALDLLLKMVVIEETREEFARASALLDEADKFATHSSNGVLRLRVAVTRLRVQRQLRPADREERIQLRRQALAMVDDEMLRRLRSYPVLLREVAAELGKEEARIAAAAIETLGVEVTSDEQARALGDAIVNLNSIQSADVAADPTLNRLIARMTASNFDPDVVRQVVTQGLTTADTKNLRARIAAAEPKADVLHDFRKYFRAGVASVMTKAIKG
jgi:hypothetical protein